MRNISIKKAKLIKFLLSLYQLIELFLIMAKINNKQIYNLIALPELSDYVIGTKEDDKKTHNFSINSIIQLVNQTTGNNSIQFQFSNGLDPEVDFDTKGRFFMQNTPYYADNASEVLVGTYDTITFNKNTLYPIDLSLLFNKIGATSNIVLTLQNGENSNNLLKFKVNSFVENATHVIFGVVNYKNFTIGNFINNKIYSLYFDIKEDSVADELIQLGTISVGGNSFYFSPNFKWIINSQVYQNLIAISGTIPFCTTGNIRKDIFVATTSNTIIRIQGVESITNPFRPNIPLNTVLVTELNVTDNNVGQIIPPTLPGNKNRIIEITLSQLGVTTFAQVTDLIVQTYINAQNYVQGEKENLYFKVKENIYNRKHNIKFNSKYN